ncbi:uncharacterized protein WM294_005979 [Sarcoramphus papa]
MPFLGDTEGTDPHSHTPDMLPTTSHVHSMADSWATAGTALHPQRPQNCLLQGQGSLLGCAGTVLPGRLHLALLAHCLASTDPHSEDSREVLPATVSSNLGASCVALGPWKEAQALQALCGEDLPAHPGPGARLESRARSCWPQGGREWGKGDLGVPLTSEHTVMLSGHHAGGAMPYPQLAQGLAWPCTALGDSATQLPSRCQIRALWPRLPPR